jgi:hypothetical protein
MPEQRIALKAEHAAESFNESAADPSFLCAFSKTR